MGLGWWHIEFGWNRRRANTDIDDDASSHKTAMSCTASWQYSMARIEVYLETVADEDDDRLEWMVVHEFMHIFLNQMRAGADQDIQRPHEERVASDLASAFIWLRQHVEESAA